MHVRQRTRVCLHPHSSRSTLRPKKTFPSQHNFYYLNGYLFFILSKMASVSLIFFWGLAFTTLRNRKPIRFKTSAMVLGEGNCSSL